MLSDFIPWYGRQMRSLIPHCLVTDPAQSEAILVGVPAGPDDPLVISLRKRNQETVIGQFARDEAGLQAALSALNRQAQPARRNVVLRLPDGVLLEREVTLPLAAERDAYNVVGFEIDRFTPFAANDVFWDTTLLRRNRSRARVELRLSVVPKAALDPILTALSHIGTKPVTIEGQGGEDVRRISLSPTTGHFLHYTLQCRACDGIGRTLE